jgi:hypothetical protein
MSKRWDSLSIPTKTPPQRRILLESMSSSAKVRPVHIHSRTLAHKGDLFLDGRLAVRRGFPVRPVPARF